MGVKFDKDEFKKSVADNLKVLYRKTVDEADKQQIFQAVSYSVKDIIMDRWLATQKTYEKEDVRTVVYMSMEFLMGRALGNNLINLTAYKEVKEALEELGFDVIPSRTNYILFHADRELREPLLEMGIQIRACANYIGLGQGWYRVAVKLPEENQKLLAALKRLPLRGSWLAQRD